MNKNKQRQHIRLILPALSGLTPDSPLAFALVGRDGRMLRTGEMPLRQLPAALGPWPVFVVLQTTDAVVARVSVPPVPPRRLTEAIQSVIEPMVLTKTDQILLAHGPRQADGMVTVAWGSRNPLLRAWSLLQESGLRPVSLVPASLLAPVDETHPDQALSLLTEACWQADWPSWSLTDGLARPGGGQRWRRPLAWTLLALAVWVLGLNAYAHQQQNHLDHLRQTMRQTVEQAFPQIPVVIDPLRQAGQQRDALRLAGGDAAAMDFLPLAMAAASILDFAATQVHGMQYRDGVLTLTLMPDYQPSFSEAVLRQAAAAQHIEVEQDGKQTQIWRVRPLNSGASTQLNSGRPAQ